MQEKIKVLSSLMDELRELEELKIEIIFKIKKLKRILKNSAFQNQITEAFRFSLKSLENFLNKNK